MANHPETIYYGRRPIRTITMNGVTKFVARDICGILGYPRADKMLNPFVSTAPEYISFKTAGGTQAVRVVERGDLENVLAHSRHGNAPRLLAWLRRHTEPTARGFVAVGVIFD